MKYSNLEKCAVIIPCYKVSNSILDVINSIGKEVEKIYVIDDGCPEKSGNLVKKNFNDQRVSVIYNKVNIGIGGSSKRGFDEAFKNENINVCIKIDGDGQMDTKNIKKFLEPFKSKRYLYVKGNRFHIHKNFLKMPLVRIFGNFTLSLISKITTGQYNTFDITNGFIALDKPVYQNIDKKNISNDYFFETSMVAEMRNIGCKVIDINIDTIYNNEKSNLKIKEILHKFIIKHILIFQKRIFKEYIKTKKIFMILLMLTIILSLGLSFFVFKFLYISILFFLIFYIRDKDFKQLEN